MTHPLLAAADTLTGPVHLWAVGAGNFHTRPDCPRLAKALTPRAGARRTPRAIVFETSPEELFHCIQRRPLHGSRTVYACSRCLTPDLLDFAVRVTADPHSYAHLVARTSDPPAWNRHTVVAGCTQTRPHHRACTRCHRLRALAERHNLAHVVDIDGYTLIAGEVPEMLRPLLAFGFATWNVPDQTGQALTSEVLQTAWQTRTRQQQRGSTGRVWLARSTGSYYPLDKLDLEVAALIHAAPVAHRRTTT